MLSILIGAVVAVGLQGAPEGGALPLNALLAAIRSQSVFRDRIDWAEAEPAVRARFALAATDEERANAIVGLLAKMGDVHTQLLYRGRAYSHYEDLDEATRQRLLPLLERERAQQGQPIAKVLDERIGCVLVPGYRVEPAEVEKAGAALRAQVDRLAASHLDGWIIDLRLNGGGNLYPMLLGLHPILGDGVVGGTTDASGRVVQRWVLRPGGLFWRDEAGDRIVARGAPVESPVNAATPVAVLVGPLTMSSGEAVALAFRGRPHTALIGAPTAPGYTTVTNPLVIDAETTLNLAVGHMADRTGTPCEAFVAPDLAVEGGESFDALGDDRRVQAALEWIRRERATASFPYSASPPASFPPPSIVQVRDEVHRPDGVTSVRVDDTASIVRDGWYHAEGETFRVRVPALKSGEIRLTRRRWESPDGTDVRFDDERAYWVAVVSADPDLTPAAEELRQKYANHLSEQRTPFEVKVVQSAFGDTVETVAMNWISSDEFPYDPPRIVATEDKLAKVGPTVGVMWTFWRGKAQYGIAMVIAVDHGTDASAAFELARREVRRIAKGLEIGTTTE